MKIEIIKLLQILIKQIYTITDLSCTLTENKNFLPVFLFCFILFFLLFYYNIILIIIYLILNTYFCVHDSKNYKHYDAYNVNI